MMSAALVMSIVYESPRTGNTHIYIFRDGFQAQAKAAMALDWMRPDLDFDFDDLLQCRRMLDRTESKNGQGNK